MTSTKAAWTFSTRLPSKVANRGRHGLVLCRSIHAGISLRSFRACNHPSKPDNPGQVGALVAVQILEYDMTVAERTRPSNPVFPPAMSFRNIRELAPDPETPVCLANWLAINRTRHLRYLRGRLPSTEDAEDVLQNATLMLLKHAKKLPTIDSLDNWVGAVLRNAVIDRYRQMAAHRRLLEAVKATPQTANEPEGDDEPSAPTACVKAALSTLRANYGKLLTQVYLEGMSIAEAAACDNLNSSNATVRLHRARIALRTSVATKCQNCTLDDCWARGRSRPLGNTASL